MLVLYCTAVALKRHEGVNAFNLVLVVLLNCFLHVFVLQLCVFVLIFYCIKILSIFMPFLPCDAMRCTVFVIVILSVRLPVCLSRLCHTRALCPHGPTYDHDFFTIW